MADVQTRELEGTQALFLAGPEILYAAFLW